MGQVVQLRPEKKKKVSNYPLLRKQPKEWKDSPKLPENLNIQLTLQLEPERRSISWFKGVGLWLLFIFGLALVVSCAPVKDNINVNRALILKEQCGKCNMEQKDETEQPTT